MKASIHNSSSAIHKYDRLIRKITKSDTFPRYWDNGKICSQRSQFLVNNTLVLLCMQHSAPININKNCISKNWPMWNFHQNSFQKPPFPDKVLSTFAYAAPKTFFTLFVLLCSFRIRELCIYSVENNFLSNSSMAKRNVNAFVVTSKI